MKNIATSAQNLNTSNQNPAKNLAFNTYPFLMSDLETKLNEEDTERAKRLGKYAKKHGYELNLNDQYLAMLWQARCKKTEKMNLLSKSQVQRTLKTFCEIGIIERQTEYIQIDGKIRRKRTIIIKPSEASKFTVVPQMNLNCSYAFNKTKFNSEDSNITEGFSLLSVNEPTPKGHVDKNNMSTIKKVTKKHFELWIALLIYLGFNRDYIGDFHNNVFPKLEIYQFNRTLETFFNLRKHIKNPGAWLNKNMKQAIGYTNIVKLPPPIIDWHSFSDDFKIDWLILNIKSKLTEDEIIDRALIAIKQMDELHESEKTLENLKGRVLQIHS